MKLSQKLLALGGVTLADYACCPYDDYGMPHPACTDALPEKTPFSLETDWRDGACKAWESNVDATFDGNDNTCETNENWGSCGFQRHFPWNEVDTEVFRNRGCVVSYDTQTSAYTANSGCNCQGLGDAQENWENNNAIGCQTTSMIAGTNDAPEPEASCVEYNADDHGTWDQAYLRQENICCNPTFTEAEYSTGADGILGVGQGDGNQVRVDCFRDCAAGDTDWLADTTGGNKPLCYATDFLGRRNIQAQNLYLSTADAYPGTAGFTASFSYDSDATSQTGATNNANLYNLAGVPFLGGVCKLYVPVPRTRIVSVQIAGVHVNLDGQSVFSSKVGSDQGINAGDDQGTAYCFSVVNPAEGMRNSNNIHNGNVAGGDNDAADPSVFDALTFAIDETSLNRQAGIEPSINFFDGTDGSHVGTQLKDTAGEANGDSEVGANFDVVVHIHSEWCNSESFWNIADMQLTGDFNNGVDDYPLNLAPGNSQLTAPAYEQTGKLQLAALRDDIIAKQDLEDTALDTYTNGPLATFEGTTCGTNLNDGSDSDAVTCLGFFIAFMNAYIAEGECNQATPGECSTLATATADAKLELMEDTNGDGTVNAGCMIVDIVGCNNSDGNNLELDEVTTLLAGANTYAIAKGVTLAAENAVNAAENNGFTHAHMDLMDKRNSMVATWNNVYQSDSGYLQFPHGSDDFFKNADGTTGTYTATDNYLRWPNAGAFAAFYSFVTCANPPYIANAGNAAEDPDVNTKSIIYSNNQGLVNNGASPYQTLGNQNLESRTLVMSQSDSDYRDEKCDARVFRGNLRQVGNSVTVCGPGQLPDTDGKRCTWNWNYHSHNEFTIANESTGNNAWGRPLEQSPHDAEEWFDRNDPHSFDMWSTRKRRSAYANDRKYAFNSGYWGVQEGERGTSPKYWDGNVAFDAENQEHANAIQIPIQDYDFNLIFKTAAGNLPSEPALSSINSVDCFEVGGTDCFCRPSHRQLTGFTDLSDNAITFAADYITTFDFDTNFESGDPKVKHSSCVDQNDVCTDAEAQEIRTNIALAQSCEFFKGLDGSGGFYQTGDNRQTLVFDDSRVVTALNPSSKKWEVSVQCTNEPNMAAIASDDSQRDMFPNCFFGDELWFTFTYSTAASNGADAYLQYNSYVSAWTSEIDRITAPSYIET